MRILNGKEFYTSVNFSDGTEILKTFSGDHTAHRKSPTADFAIVTNKVELTPEQKAQRSDNVIELKARERRHLIANQNRQDWIDSIRKDPTFFVGFNDPEEEEELRQMIGYC